MSDIVKLKYEEEDLKMLAGFALLDDDFMTIVFDRNIEAAELVIYVNGSYKNDADPVGKLHQAIANYIGNNNGECEALAAPFAVFLNEDDMNYVEPDISVICDLSKLDDKGCHGAPDWVIEIVSPSSKPRDYMAKLFKYRMAGVRDCLYYNRNHSLYG